MHRLCCALLYLSAYVVRLILFSVRKILIRRCLVGHLFQMIKYRPMWWLIPTVLLAGVGEILGWSGRLWSSLNVDEGNAFTIQ